MLLNKTQLSRLSRDATCLQTSLAMDLNTLGINQSYIPTVKSCPLKQHSSKLAPPSCRQRSFVEIPWLLPYSSQGSTLKKQHQTPQNPHGNKTHPHRHTGKKQQTTENTTTACTVQAFIEQKEEVMAPKVKMAKCKKAKCIF